MAQDLGLISRRGVERLMRGDVDPDRLIEEAQNVKNVSAMDLYKKYLSISFEWIPKGLLDPSRWHSAMWIITAAAIIKGNKYVHNKIHSAASEGFC